MTGSQALSRQTTVRAAFDSGYEFWTRQYSGENDSSANENQDLDSETKQEWSFGPDFLINSESERSSLVLRYAPLFKYDSSNNTDNINHALDFKAIGLLSKKWFLSLSDNYALTDNTVLTETSSTDQSINSNNDGQNDLNTDELTRNEGRELYWLNNAVLMSTYTFYPDSQVLFWYGYKMLRNVSSSAQYTEYDKHSLHNSISYRFNQRWKSFFKMTYSRGNFNSDNNEENYPDTYELNDYQTELSLSFFRVKDSVALKYNNITTLYDNSSYRDISFHSLIASWQHDFNQMVSFSIGCGPSFIDPDGLASEWSYTLYSILTRTYEHASLSLLLEKKYENETFSGSEQSGLKDIYKLELDMVYNVSPFTKITLSSNYRYKITLDPIGDYYEAAENNEESDEEKLSDLTYSQNQYEIRLGIDYKLRKWLTTSLQYSFFTQTGDLESDSYTDHTILFQIKVWSNLWMQ